MKYLLIVIAFCTIGNITAQHEESRTIKKVIKKEIHEDDDQKMSKSIDIQKEIIDGKEVETYVIKIKKDGKEKVLKWNGEGEMPKEIKEVLEGDEELEMEENAEFKIVEIIEEEDDGTTKIMKWRSGEEIPTEMKDKMKELEVDEILENDSGLERRYHIQKTKDGKDLDVKVRMGIGLSADENGVSVEYVEEGSPAEKAKLQEGDVILKVDNQYIFTTRTLMNTLAKYNPGDEVKIIALRSDQEIKLKLTLIAK